MCTQITKNILDFVNEAKENFEQNPMLETYKNKSKYDLIALRMGEDRDCVLVYELADGIANFVQQIDPCPKPSKVVYEFAHDMEKQLKVNDHKGGWGREHHQFLVQRIGYNLKKLSEEFAKEDRDKYEITIRCANIANYAMMIANNEGEHL